ncbi:hypothetical protein Trydic_g3990 [Trypoxylus dichotomus]
MFNSKTYTVVAGRLRKGGRRQEAEGSHGDRHRLKQRKGGSRPAFESRRRHRCKSAGPQPFRARYISITESLSAPGSSIDNVSTAPISYLVIAAVITVAWEKVSPATAKKCFSKTGFSDVIQENTMYDEEKEMPHARLFRTVRNEIVDFNEYASVDSYAPTEGPNFSIIEIVEELCNNHEEQNSDNSNLNECETRKNT